MSHAIIINLTGNLDFLDDFFLGLLGWDTHTFLNHERAFAYLEAGGKADVIFVKLSPPYRQAFAVVLYARYLCPSVPIVAIGTRAGIENCEFSMLKGIVDGVMLAPNRKADFEAMLTALFP